MRLRQEPFRIQEFGGPEGIRTPDLLNAMPGADGPPESTNVVFELKPDSDYRRSVHRSSAEVQPIGCQNRRLRLPRARSTAERFERGDNHRVCDCCSASGYRRIFSEGNARAEAKRYRRKGLDATSKRVVDFLRGQGVQGRTVLEVGGGIGAIQLELLKAGAVRAVSVELTPTYEDVAHELINEAAVGDRVERKLMDFAATPEEVEVADVVIMNRVICCYPDMPRLASAASRHARELLVMSYPRESWWTRIGVRVGNFLLRIARREFQVFLHSPSEIIAISEEAGFTTLINQEGFFWTVAALRRSTPGAALG